MPDWIFKNKPTAYATLAVDSGTSGTTLTLNAGHGGRVPAPGVGQISAARIENELITYTGNSGDVLTGVTRGAGATNHVAGTEVKNVLVEEWANAVTALSTDTKAALAGTSGTPQAANPYVTDADARNSNARTPTAHGHVESDTTGLVADLAARVLTTDSRLSDARTPTAHAISHKATGGDVLAGIVGGYAPLDSGLLVPVANLGTGTPTGLKFLRDDRVWAVPAGGGGGGGNVTYTSAYASPPASPNAGDFWMPSDSYAIYRYSGTTWVPWGPVYPFTAPVDGDFSWINQGGASVSTTNGGIALSAPTDSGTPQVRVRKKTAPATPYTITMAMLPFWGTADNNFVAVGFRESSSGKLHLFEVDCVSGALRLVVAKWTDASTFSALYSGPTTANWLAARPLWLRIADNGTNRVCSLSGDGQNFDPFHTVGRTDYMTANEVLFAARCAGGTNVYSTLLSWKEA
jgi:hypothetical protein